MKTSELIAALENLISEYGDLEILHRENGTVSDVGLVEYMKLETLPPVFVIS